MYEYELGEWGVFEYLYGGDGMSFKAEKRRSFKSRLGVDDKDRILMMAETPTQSLK